MPLCWKHNFSTNRRIKHHGHSQETLAEKNMRGGFKPLLAAVCSVAEELGRPNAFAGMCRRGNELFNEMCEEKGKKREGG